MAASHDPTASHTADSAALSSPAGDAPDVDAGPASVVAPVAAGHNGAAVADVDHSEIELHRNL